MTTAVPVITIDGPGGAGKGTLSAKLVQELGWHSLDSGAVYRALAYKLQQQKIIDSTASDSSNYWERVRDQAENLQLNFVLDSANQGRLRVLIDGHDCTSSVRSESVALAAAKIAIDQITRRNLRALQCSFRRAPGLIADGRDMGSVVFPDAVLKVYLTADSEERIRRKELEFDLGDAQQANQLRTQLHTRDAKDTQREHSPMVIPEDALVIDSTKLNASEVAKTVLDRVRELGL